LPRQLEGGLTFDFDSLQTAIGQLRARQIFFVGAMPKSGTTWLQRLLDSHPDVSCTGEGHFPNRLMPSLKKTLEQHNALLKYKSDIALEGLGTAPMFSEDHFHYLTAAAIALFLISSCRGRAVRAIGEKTPDNLVHFPLLASLFPRAKFIAIIRDPRDCAVSAWFHNSRIGAPEFKEKFRSMEQFIDFVVQQWARSTAYALKLRGALGERMFMLRYEDLLADPDPPLQALFQFLGVATSPEILRRCVEKGKFEAMTGGRQSGDEVRGAFLRNGTAGDWRNHLDTAAQARVLKLAGAVMKPLGYS
jgi:hypothetical protein